MPVWAPISYHLDLYRYWLGTRNGRIMPARSDINPADIPQLQPYLSIVDKVDGQFRYRLVGTAIVRQWGREPTGSFVGSHVSYAPECVAALQAIGERVFTTAHPVFTTGRYETKSGTIHNVSALLLPLSDDGTNVNMIILTRIARFNFDVRVGIGWLKGASLKIGDVVNVDAAAEFEKLCLDWERHCRGTAKDPKRCRA